MESNQESLSANKRALLKIRELKQQLASQAESAYEPIAVVSMACRFPRHADTPERFWEQLISKESFVRDVPESRWDRQAFFDEDPDAPGKMYTQKGVYLDSVDQMDPEFFGVSPREATWVDPQQRLLMEVSWEAIERAGWIPEKVGDSTGVFVGWMHNDYQNEASDSFLNLNPYIATGAAGSFLSGRLAYYLGLRGPALAVDTACSSSLVALHLAIQSLQKKECDRALVGGVNVICSPTTNILTCKLKALSRQGHSRAFDASADGYLRGEGCGVVALRRLSDAHHSNDRILGIIRGSAVGHNGFSSGLTAPNPKAQEQVIRQAVDRAGCDAKEIVYLEAHGTGTELGDPLEVQAASSALCQHRDESNPLWIGSVKTNIGHLEAAAGMAGLIKVLLAMQHQQIPGQLNFEQPNPHIPWDKTAVEVLKEDRQWPREKKRIAGVSAFGMSGTNAHVVVEAPDEFPSAHKNVSEDESEPERSRPGLLVVSAKNEKALFTLANKYAEELGRDSDLDLAAFCRASQMERSHFAYRAAIVCGEANEPAESLRTIARGQADEWSAVGQASKRFKLVWQFTGQGSQYTGMGSVLYQSEPVFRRAIDQCRDWSREIQNDDLTEILFSDPEKIHDTRWTQPGIFAIQMGLAVLLNDWGIRPDLVLGHSVGQYAAACVAGILSWRDGFRLISERGRLISQLPREGKMLAVFARNDEVAEKVGNREGVNIGAFNVSHVVVSGESKTVDAIELDLQSAGIRTRALNTSHAFHSGLMDPVLDEFAGFAEQFEFGQAEIPLICNLSGEVMPPDFQCTGRYWADHIRGAVQFEKSLSYVKQYGADAVLELGPRPVLTGMANAMGLNRETAVTSCLDPKQLDPASLQLAVATLYSRGLDPDFEKLAPEHKGNHVDLPTYPFQRKRYWGPDKPRAAHAEHHTALPLLGSQLPLANVQQEKRYEVFVDVDSPAWIADHQVMGATVMPGAAFVELAIEATRRGEQAIELESLRFESPLRIEGRTALQTVVRKLDDAQDDAAKPNYLESYSRNESLDKWTRHFSVESGRLVTRGDNEETIDLESLKSRFKETIDVEDFYSFLESIDLNYGQRFQTIQTLYQTDNGVLARLEEQADLQGYYVSPPLLDGAFHSLATAISRSGEEMFLPVSLDRICVYGDLLEQAWCHAEWVEKEGDIRTANLRLYSDQGQLLVEIEKLTVKRIERAAIRKANRSGPEKLLYEFQWRPSRLAGKKMEQRNWWIISSSTCAARKADALGQALTDQGHQCNGIKIEEDRVLLQGNEKGTESETVERPADQDVDWNQIQRRLQQRSESTDSLDGIIWILDHDGPVGARGSETESNARGLVSLIQWLRKSGVKGLNAGFQLLTENAIATNKDSNDFSVDPRQSQYWGLGRVLSAECPEFRCRMIDSDGNLEGPNNNRLLTEVILTEGEENQIALRNNECLVPRIVNLDAGTEAKNVIRGDRGYLITGGLGKLGRQAARWLVNHGATQVVLVSRREPDDETQCWIDELTQGDAEVAVQNLDIGEQPKVRELFDKFGSVWKPLGGVIHAAGVLDDGLIDNQNWSRFEKVLRPKVDAGWNLHEASLDHQPDFFILYSSIAAVLGSPGQSNYAMGNGYLDGLADYRRMLGLPAVAINWGPWTEGMADDERVKKRLAVQGITALEVDEAHAAMELSLSAEASQSFVIDVDWRKLKLGADGKTPLILSELVTQRQKSAGGESQLVAKLKKLLPPAQQEFLVKTVQELFQQVLASDTPPEIDRPLIEMGLDSLMAVEFGTGLQQAFGGDYEIGPSILFDHPTIESIAEYLGSLVLKPEESDEAAVPDSQECADQAGEKTAIREIQREDIAIVGMSCQFPGADSVDEYWSNLLAGVDSVGEIPADRWDIDKFFSSKREPGKMYTRQGGFRHDIDKFDAAFFNIPDNEACWIDPQHRMLLENSYHALEDAGIRTKPLADPNVGVFMGIMGQDYAFLPSLEDKNVVQGFEGAGLSHSAGVGRISYLLGLEGPSVAVDTASSSSLVAVIQAVRSLQEGNCNLALAGGVNAILAPVNSLLMSKAGLLSPDGRCKSFSEQADGFGRGEGCGVIVLKRLSDAQRDNDRILSVIRGGAIGHNGFNGGLTTPSSKAQVRVIQSAIKDAGVTPADVQYLEAHGTGTEFGDPIEMAAAVQVYGKGRSKDKPLVVGSAKANIGHLEAAGGVSGLIKAVLSLHHGVVPPQIHFESPSKHIPWKRMPVTVPTEKVEWEEESLQLAAVTALGLAGTNAHLILSSCPVEMPEASQADVDEKVPDQSRQQVLFLSANSGKALSGVMAQYYDYFEQLTVKEGTVSWDNICYSSATGRQHFGFRECLVASSIDEAKDLLSQKIEFANDAANHNGIGDNGTAKNGMGGRLESKPKVAFHQQKTLWYFPGDESITWNEIQSLGSQFQVVSETLNRFSQQLQHLNAAKKSLDELCGNSNAETRDLTQFFYLACMAQLWQEWGWEPDVVTGTGVGLWVAGCVADVMSFEDAFEMLFYLYRHRENLDWQAYENFLDEHNFYPPSSSLICPVSGEEIAVHRTLGGSYWQEVVRESADSRLLWKNSHVQECDWIMDMGSATGLPETKALKARILFCCDETGSPAVNLLKNLADLYLAGFDPDFEKVYKDQATKKVPLPVYPFERRRFWITEMPGGSVAETIAESPNGGKTHV